MLQNINREQFEGFDEWELDEYESFINADFEWACDSCLSNKNAIIAIPNQQDTPWSKHLAYSDKELQCFECKKQFVFKKEEKQVWYESYKLPKRSEPSNCLKCRREIRTHKSENKTISQILAKPIEEVSVSELEEVVKIYTAWDKLDRAKYFQSVINKRKGTTANNG